jgi:hypothetical protein
VSPHAHQSNRLSDVQRLVGRALGGRPGQRLLSRLGIPVSRHTLLRQVVTAVPASALTQQALRVVGVDDWAWRKGQSFGTILVDLERSEVVDVLPTRSAKVLSEWLIQRMRQSKPTVDKCGCLAAQGAGVSSAMRCSGVFASPGRMSAR